MINVMVRYPTVLALRIAPVNVCLGPLGRHQALPTITDFLRNHFSARHIPDKASLAAP
jgi:hypothetical protein